MAVENRLWGAESVRGELLKLGISVSKRTIQRYMPKQRRESGQTWATFLKNHAGDIWACDFSVVHDLLFRPLYIFIVIELKRRRIVHTAVTRHPTDAWTAQQLREATAWGKGPKYLIRDRDKKYGRLFSAVAGGTSIKELKAPIQTPRASAICERFIGNLRRECLDHMFVLQQEQLHRTVKEYVSFYNHMRPHQGIQQQIPVPCVVDSRPTSVGNTTRIMSTPILRGLHYSYSDTAYLN
jgi:transposase InsO family protein